MKKVRIITKRRISYILMTALFMLCCLLFVSDSISFICEKYIKSTGTYLPMEYEIDNYEGEEGETTYTQLSSIYNISGSTVTEKSSSQTFTSETLLIATAEELYAFSVLANNFDKYLTYKYKLSANIDYSECSYKFIPLAWADGKAFSGSFDGDGFEIKNLNFIELSSTESPVATLDYFAMFSKNSGTIQNLGLVDAIIVINLSNDDQIIDISGVAPLCGLNTGIIQNVYAVDLGNAADEESGIYAAGGYTISGLVCESTGTFTNAYTAYSIISNYGVSDVISFHEIISTVSGTANNLYFYNASIDSIERKVDESDGEIKDFIKYDNGLIGKTYARMINDNIVYCKTLDILATNLDFNNIWYTKNSYSDSVTKGAIGLETPILRGLEEDINDSKTLYINSTKDFLYMFELMNHDSIFASNAYTYKITADIDMSNLPDYTYQYDSYINAKIIGTEASRTTLKDVKGDYSPYPTIYGASISNTVLTEGIECFGLFPYLTGTIQNLNLYYIDTKLTNFEAIGNNANIRALGLVSGVVEGGIIDNVNVYGNILLNNGFGRHYIGGIAGVLTEKGSITNCTTAGSVNAGSNHSIYDNQQVTGYINGNSIGGVVGFATSTNGTLNACMSAMNLTLASYSSSNSLNQAIGGVLGSGYTTLSGDLDDNTGLSNKGSISIGQISTNYGVVYAAGIIGRHIGLSKQVNNFYNQGDITIVSNANTNYVSGITNVDILSSTVNGLTSSTLKNSNGKISYWASSFTNAANINITGSNDVKTSGMVYINANENNNNFASIISGFYNIGYRYVVENSNIKKQTISANEIDFSSISNYAACVVSTGVSANNSIEAETIYNLKDIDFTTSENIQNTNMNYSGVFLGNYIDFIDIRNEGDLTFTITNATSDTSILSINGVFEELSSNCTAKNIFNGGDITITDTTTNTKNIDIYISGICKTNASVITDSKYNPLNEDFDNTTIGSLNNAINNGDILVTSESIEKDVKISEYTSTTNLHSNIFVGGITYLNSGIISNTFNLGNVDLELASPEVLNYCVGGITCINSGQYAQIRDCANNGDLTAIDLYKSADTEAESLKSVVNVGGICAINGSGSSINQVIAFSINYGTITSFQAGQNMEIVAAEASHANAGGILAVGICNMVNIVNYGNVYSSECSGGLAAVVDLGNYDNVTVNIANTINYANIRAIPRYFNKDGDPKNYITFNEVANYEQLEDSNDMKRTNVGALVSVFDFNGESNFNIRYLINLYNGASVVFRNINAPTINSNMLTTFVSTKLYDVFGTKEVAYAPLSTINDGNNVGVFSEEFMFRKAINGVNLDVNYVTDSYIGDFFQFIRFDKINEKLLQSMGWKTIAYADAAENLAKNLEALAILIDASSSESLLEEAFTTTTWISNSDTTILESFIELSLDTNELDSSLETILNLVLFSEEYKSDFSTTIKSELFNVIMTYYEEQQGENLDYYELLNKLLYPELVARIISGDTSDLSKVQLTIKKALKSSDDLSNIYQNYVNVLLNENDASTSILSPLFESDYYTQAKLNLLDTLLSGYSEETLETILKETNPSDAADELKYLMYLQANTTVAKDIYKGMIAFNSLSDIDNTEYMNVINSNLSKYNVDSYLTAENIATLKNLYPEWDADETIQDELTVNRTTSKQIQTLTPILYSNTNIVAEHNYSELWNMIKTDANVQSFISNNYFKLLSNPTSGTYYNGLLAKATEYNNTYQSNDASQSSYGIPESYRGGISYGGRNGGDYFDNSTETSTTHYGVNEEIKTRFVYTPDSLCSWDTTYYGPFTSNSESQTKIINEVSTQVWGVLYDDGYLSKSGYNLGYDLATVIESNQTTDTVREMVPVYISANKNDLATAMSNSNSTATNTYIYPFYWNNNSSSTGLGTNNTGDFAWKSEAFTTSVSNGNTYGYLYSITDASQMSNDSDFDANYLYSGYNFTPGYVSTKQKDVDNGLVNTNSSASHPNKSKYFVAYATATIITGVWYYYSMWQSSGAYGSSLFAKNQTPYSDQDNSNGHWAVHTTDYIGYTMSDLVNLDGYRTKGKYYEINGAKEDNDEINIISAIVENMLATEEGQVAIMNAISNYYKGNNVTVDNSKAAEMLLSSLTETSFANEFVISTLNDILSLGFTDPNTSTSYDSIGNYLESLNISLDSIKDEIIARATNDMSNLRKVVLAIETIHDKIEKYSDYQYDRNEVNRLIYDYILNRYGTTIDENESTNIDFVLNDSSDDLSYMSNLLLLTEYLDDNYSDSGFTFTGDWRVNALESNTTIDDNTYSNNLLAETGATITFNSSSYTKLKLVYKGNISVNGTQYNNNSIISREIDLTTNTNYTITFNDGAEFYDISFEIPNIETTITPFASAESNATWNNTYYQINGSNTAATFNLGNYSGWNATLLINARRSTSSTTTFTSSYTTDTFTMSSSYDDYPIFSDVELTSSSITITNTSSRSNRYLQIQYLLFTFTKTLADGTVISVTQQLEGDTYTNNSIDVNRNDSTATLTYDNTQLSAHSSPVTFKLTTYTYNQLDLNNVTTNYIKSIENNFNDYYANISDIGRYLIEGIIVPVNSITTVSVTAPSFLIIYANSTNSNGTISINNGATPSSISIESNINNYYAIYLPSLGSYTISSSNATISNLYVVNEDAKLNISGNTITDEAGNVLSSVTYSNISQFIIDNIIENDTLSAWQKYEIYVDSYLNYRGNTTSNTYLEDYSALRENDIFEFISTVYGTITEDTNSQTYYTVFIDEVFTKSVLKNIIELLVLADDTAFELLIKELNNTYYDELIKSISNEKIQKNIFNVVVDIVNEGQTDCDQVSYYIMASYLGNDYLNNLNTLNNSIMYNILSRFENGKYQFINNDNSINATIFTDLLTYLTSGNSSIDLGGYGIFALSSSKGILNGQFIPDNIVLDGLDGNYTYNSTDNHWELSDDASSNWRGGDDATNKNDITDINSVNYGVLVEMKQLKKSISTTIFTLDLSVLDDNQEIILYSSEELIDLENHVITYYVPEGLDLSNVSVDEYSIANLASFKLNKASIFSLEDGDNEAVITITAEDTTIVADYSIMIIRFEIESIDLSLDQESSLGESVPSANGANFDMEYIDGYISLNLISQTLPKGLDIEPYLSITDESGNEINSNEIKKYELDTKAYIDEYGSTKINIILLDTMTYGLYTITVNVFGVSDSMTFYKKPSTLNNIESFIYEGNDLVDDFNSNLELTTYIPFGRCYDYNELSDASYLSNITVSTGATLDIDVSKNDEDLITYTIKYTVTSESGVAREYTHYLIELNPLDVDGNIANVYRNGSAVNDAISDDNSITLSFRRGEEAPSYKIKYNLTNIYNDGTYDYIIGDENVEEYIGVACDAKYSGITIEISDVADAGTYLYNYTFNNSGEWLDGTYTKIYTFPLITIIKNYAVDSELKRLTFLDSQLTLGAAYTVMYPEYSIRPGDNVNANEVKYNDLKNDNTGTLSPISVAAKTITYSNNSNLNSNFYAVGTLDNAELSNYAPTFGIYEYSEIYQYTTLDKLTGYGAGHDVIDYDVVNTDSTQEDLYLYVPYENSNKEIEIFMVKVENGVWTDVYDTSFDGSDDYPKIAENIGYKGSFNDYTISDTAGTTSGENKSLYMDYIGTPLNDHFWWVSYVIFSEDYMRNPSNENTNLKFYHISLIDISNTIYFEFTFDTPQDFDVSSMYISIVDRVYDNIDEQDEVYSNTVNINAFARLDGTNYSLVHKLQVLPRGYFYFNITLPGGYTCSYTITNGKTNQNNNDAEGGAYLPPASIVTQKVDITITITKTTEDDAQTDIWAESTSSEFVIQATEVVQNR